MCGWGRVLGGQAPWDQDFTMLVTDARQPDEAAPCLSGRLAWLNGTQSEGRQRDCFSGLPLWTAGRAGPPELGEANFNDKNGYIQ